MPLISQIHQRGEPLEQVSGGKHPEQQPGRGPPLRPPGGGPGGDVRGPPEVQDDLRTDGLVGEGVEPGQADGQVLLGNHRQEDDEPRQRRGGGRQAGLPRGLLRDGRRRQLLPRAAGHDRAATERQDRRLHGGGPLQVRRDSPGRHKDRKD